MPKIRRLFPLLAGLAFAHAAIAQEAAPAHAIDVEYQRCIDAADGSDPLMGDCANAAHEAWDVQMNATYNKLLAALSPDQRKLLRDAQRRWLAYRDAEFELIWELHRDSGTLGRLMVHTECMDVVRQRALVLADYQSSWDM
jgi:uncharacterized protein YecT (DUF1311 family)